MNLRFRLMNRYIAYKLKLNPEQQAKLVDFRRVLRQSRKDMHDIQRDQWSILKQLLQTAVFPRKEVLGIFEIPYRAYHDQMEMVVDAFQAFYESLDDSQKEQLFRWLDHYRFARSCHPV